MMARTRERSARIRGPGSSRTRRTCTSRRPGTRASVPTTAPWVLLLNPDTEWWKGTLADYVRVARSRPRAGIVGPMVRDSDGAIYPSGRPFPGIVDAVGHAFLGTLLPGNRFTRRYHLQGWDRTTRSRGGLGERLLHADRPRGARGGRSARRRVPPLRRGARPGHAACAMSDVASFYTSAVEVVHEAGVSIGADRAGRC